MNQTIIFLLSVLLLSLSAHAQPLLEFYVSPSGKDSWQGTLKRPFKTLERAQKAVRNSHSLSGNHHITVYLRGGKYQIDKTLKFSTSDGAKSGGKVTYKAFEDEKPELTGGKRITGWSPDKDGVFKASCRGMGFRQLYVNNGRAVRAREPDVGTYHKLTGWDLKGQHLIMDSGYIKRWENLEQIEAVIQMFWAEAIVHLKSVEKIHQGANHAYIAIKDEQSEILFPRPYPQKQDNAAFHFENAYEFLDQPGEWYLNPNTEVLYYKPFPGEDIKSLEIIAPVTQTLINIEGTLEEPVKNLVFEGLIFEHSNWDLPSKKGFINAQTGMYNLTANEDNYQTVRRPIAAIRVKNARKVAFQKNLFQHMGSTAIDFEKGTRECLISGNVIRSIAGNGIMIGAFTAEKDGEYHVPYNPTDVREVSTADEVSNNYIYKVGRDYFGTCPIAAGYPAELKIVHNQIMDAPYTGISLGYGWTGEPNAMHDNLVAYNHISNVMNLLCDGGGIYTLSMQPGTRIVKNYINNIKRSPWAGPWPIASIYLDEKSGGTLEHPMVLSRNSLPITDKSVKHWNLHKEGIILLNNNSVYLIPDVAENAGLEKDFEEVIKSILQK